MLALHLGKLPTTQLKKKGLITTFIAMNPYLFGAGEMNRTPDLLITNELLYRLSYTGFNVGL